MKIYTKTGDAGETSLWGGERVPKTDPLIEAIGDVDELNAAIGICAAYLEKNSGNHLLLEVQSNLFTIGALLASHRATGRKNIPVFSASATVELEAEIDVLDRQLSPLKNFILPGGSIAVASIHLARSICRRAERRCIALSDSPAMVVVYLNRLSDYLFVLSRFTAKQSGISDVLWIPGKP